MNENVTLLQHAAGLEKQAYAEYVTMFSSSGITTLVKGGVGFDTAAGMIKEACKHDEQLVRLQTNILAFEKAAEYIEAQDEYILDLEKTAAEGPAQASAKVEKDSPLSKLASIGFSQEEIEMMSQLPENLITKVASAGSQPWEMGSGTGLAREKTDPLLEFILG